LHFADRFQYRVSQHGEYQQGGNLRHQTVTNGGGGVNIHYFAVGAHIVCECDTEISSRRTKVKKDEELSREAVLHEVFGGSEELMAKYTMLRTAVYGRTRITLLTPASEEE